jgi:hypothetical protein
MCRLECSAKCPSSTNGVFTPFKTTPCHTTTPVNHQRRTVHWRVTPATSKSTVLLVEIVRLSLLIL